MLFPTSKIQIFESNSQPDEYEWYLSGFAEGNLRLRVCLESDIETDQKDAYKNLSAERRRQALDEKIKDLFGS